MREGIGFVNASQLIQFKAPVCVFSRVRVETTIVCTDARFAYFSHAVFLQDRKCAEILVKMKFKKRGLTVSPGDITGIAASEKPRFIEDWDAALNGMQ